MCEFNQNYRFTQQSKGYFRSYLGLLSTNVLYTPQLAAADVCVKNKHQLLAKVRIWL